MGAEARKIRSIPARKVDGRVTKFSHPLSGGREVD
jgi:hypothetical protein